MSTVEAHREAARKYNRAHRLDPEWVARTNAARRGKYVESRRVYLDNLRDGHFFRWRKRHWRWAQVTAWELMCLWRRQRGVCALSGRPLGRDAHLDHIVPKSVGGTSTIENLRWLDPQVNVARANLSDAEFVALCSQVVEVIGRRILEAA